MTTKLQHMCSQNAAVTENGGIIGCHGHHPSHLVAMVADKHAFAVSR